jgi:tight adherence protein C
MSAPGDFLSHWLPAGVSLDDVVSIVAGVATFVVLGMVYQVLSYDGSLARRLKQLADRRQKLRATGLIARSRRARPSRLPQGLMHRILHQLNLLRSHEAREAQRLLAQAGYRSNDAMVLFLFCRLTLPCLFGLAAAIDIFMVPVLPIVGAARLPVLILAIAAGLFAPTIYLKNASTKRRAALQKGLPDGLDLLVICVEAGLTLDAALTRVARELGRSWPALADEFGLTAIELAFLADRRQALENLGARSNLPALRGVINTLQQAEKFGTPLASSLRVLSAEFRESRMMRAEEKAARLPSLLTVPMMIFILPVLFIVLLGPALLGALRAIHGT